jgi:hypothetical protein
MRLGFNIDEEKERGEYLSPFKKDSGLKSDNCVIDGLKVTWLAPKPNMVLPDTVTGRFNV